LEIAFIALIVGAIGFVTTLYVSVNERIKEIGTLKAIGAKPWFILSMFLREAVSLVLWDQLWEYLLVLVLHIY
jgi:putative ABC transport system permease protein